MEFHKLTCHGNEMSITHKKPFDTAAKAFKPETIKKVFDFAFDMTFGNKGAHRVHRTGGTVYRKKVRYSLTHSKVNWQSVQPAIYYIKLIKVCFRISQFQN